MASSYERFVQVGGRLYRRQVDLYSGCTTLADFIIREQEVYEIGQVGYAYLELSDCLLDVTKHNTICNFHGLVDVWGRHCSYEYIKEMKSLDIPDVKEFLEAEIQKLYYYCGDSDSDVDSDADSDVDDDVDGDVDGDVGCTDDSE